jgi:hypothetical protein
MCYIIPYIYEISRYINSQEQKSDWVPGNGGKDCLMNMEFLFRVIKMV